MSNSKLRNKAFFSILAMIVCILLGCQKKDELVLSQVQEEELQLQEVSTETVSEEAESGEVDSEKAGSEETTTKETVTEPEIPKIIVHICGAVCRPGVYELTEGDRICQAVEKAGGFTEDADENLLNQAQKLVDGMQLVIPTRQEAEKALEEGTGDQSFLRYTGQMLSSSLSTSEGNGLININTATEEMLCTLPGVGSEKARSIIAYRTEHGSYQRIEDIMNVTGIKEGMFAKMKDKITV